MSRGTASQHHECNQKQARAEKGCGRDDLPAAKSRGAGPKDVCQRGTTGHPGG
jgi:hypothetical protein